MNDIQEAKLRCLAHADGNLSQAKEFFEWVGAKQPVDEQFARARALLMEWRTEMKEEGLFNAELDEFLAGL